MLSHLLRHARTGYSAAYRVNGRPELAVPLDQGGQDQCRIAWATPPLDDITTCVVSEFCRTAQTAELLLAGRSVPTIVDCRLNEIDYGEFEGGPFLEYGRWLRIHGPWQRPPGARESQREAILRMLDGLREALTHPGPRLVVAHGLLVSVMGSTRAGRPLSGAFFPEAPHVAALTFADKSLLSLTGRLAEEINAERTGIHRSRAAEFLPTGSPTLVTFSAAEPYEEKDRHA